MEKIEIHERRIAGRKRGIQDWLIPQVEKKELARFLEQLELGRVNKGVRISESRQCKYLDVLRTPLEFFNKLSVKLVVKDIEAFEKALSSGTLTSNRGKPYSHNTKVDMRRALKVYLRWRLGEAKSLSLTDWFDTRDIAKTPDFLKEADIEKLYKACKTAQERFLIAILFDTGARATEFHNLRYEDIQLPEGEKNYIKIALKEEYSKTKGRTISLFWTRSAEAIREYLKERERQGIRSADPVFTLPYGAARHFLHRLGKTILQRSIHYHLFRHSSATYYADKMNRQQLCIRYGWAFSSRMPDIYIARAGVDNVELDQKFANAEVAPMKQAMEKMQQSEKLKDERIKHLERTIANIERDFERIAKELAKNPSIQEVQRALARKP